VRAAALVLPVLVLIAALAACGGGGDDPLTVFAAASLADVLPKVDGDARYSFGGSDQLAAQIRSGAPADVFASASPKYPDELFAAGLAGRPRTFATNRLVAIVRLGYSGELSSLTDPGVKLVLAAEGVPAGDYARAALAALGMRKALDNVVSQEDDVKAVVAKVALAEADAAFVYATDVRPVADKVRVLTVPDDVQPRIEYAVTVVRKSAVADAFVARLLSPEGRAVLRDAGFGPP
jgi:molybdate transport system substrate-binding protein